MSREMIPAGNFAVRPYSGHDVPCVSNLPIKPVRAEVQVCYVGGKDLLYDQIVRPNGELTRISAGAVQCVFTGLNRRNFQTFFQQDPRVGPISVLQDKICLPHLANRSVRYHAQSMGPDMLYDAETGELLEAIGSSFGPLRDVENNTVFVIASSLGPSYHIHLPTYPDRRIYVDTVSYRAEEIIGMLDLATIDSGMRKFMKANQVEYLNMVYFYGLNKALFKQVLLLHPATGSTLPAVETRLGYDEARTLEPGLRLVWPDTMPQVRNLRVHCTCETLREEFHLGGLYQAA